MSHPRAYGGGYSHPSAPSTCAPVSGHPSHPTAGGPPTSMSMASTTIENNIHVYKPVTVIKNIDVTNNIDNSARTSPSTSRSRSPTISTIPRTSIPRISTLRRTSRSTRASSSTRAAIPFRSPRKRWRRPAPAPALNSPQCREESQMPPSGVAAIGAAVAAGRRKRLRPCRRRYRHAQRGDRPGAPAMHHPGRHHRQGHPCRLRLRRQPRISRLNVHDGRYLDQRQLG